MKMKKVVAAVTCATMACVFATGAFAATDAQVARAQSYLNSKGINYTVQASDVDKALAAGYTADALAAKADAIYAQAANGDVEGAKNAALAVLNSCGISVSGVNVSVSGGQVSVTANVNGQNVALAVASVDQHPEIGEAIANGTWGVDSSTQSAAGSLTSSNSVVKATGDHSAVAMLLAVVAVAGVMGVAVRKSNIA